MGSSHVSALILFGTVKPIHPFSFIYPIQGHGDALETIPADIG